MAYAPPPQPGQVWRQGKYLVMEKSAQLPPYCIKTNQPCEGSYLKRNLYWHHPAIYLALLLNILIYVILALVMRKSAVVQFGLSRERKTRRIMWIIFGWVGCLAFLVMSCAGMLATPTNPGGEPGPLQLFMLLGGGFLFLVTLIVSIIQARVVAPKKITDHLVILKGASPEFLARFKEYPYTPEW